MPIDLRTTAPLRGEQPPRKWTLVVTSHGRWEYLAQTMDSVPRGVFTREILAYDGPPVDLYEQWLRCFSHFATTGRRSGLTANLTQAWGSLTAEDEWVLHLEEDMVLREAPLEQMADVLDQNRDLAQMALVRQPWSAEEHHAGGMLHGPHYAGGLTDEGGWLRQRRLFTLNPFVARASLLRTLQPGVESSLTQQCLQRGLSFGFWGGIDDPPRVEHVGYEGGMGSSGWRS